MRSSAGLLRGPTRLREPPCVKSGKKGRSEKHNRNVKESNRVGMRKKKSGRRQNPSIKAEMWDTPEGRGRENNGYEPQGRIRLREHSLRHCSCASDWFEVKGRDSRQDTTRNTMRRGKEPPRMPRAAGGKAARACAGTQGPVYKLLFTPQFRWCRYYNRDRNPI